MSWTPTLSQGATYLLTLHATGYDETGSLKIGVADKFDDPANVPISDPTSRLMVSPMRTTTSTRW